MARMSVHLVRKFLARYLRPPLLYNRFATRPDPQPSNTNREDVSLNECCGNGCRDCVLLSNGAAEFDDYFAELEAKIAATSVPPDDKTEKNSA